MKRVLAIAILVIGASYLMAANPPASSADKSPANPSAIEQPAPPPAPVVVPEGWLANSLGANRLTKKTRIRIWDYAQGGFSTNNTVQKGDASTGSAAYNGDANGPVATPPDVDTFEFDQLELWIQRDIRGNIGMGGGPQPRPMYHHFDWGFNSETDYGRQANGGRMAGFERDWSINPSAKNDYTQRYLWLQLPNVNMDLWLPFYKGIALRIGRQPDQLITKESPVMMRFSPDMFYSHAYGFYRNSMMVGIRVAANIMHSDTKGLLMGEFFVANGNEWGPSVYSTSGRHPGGYGYQIAYRTPKMGTAIDYDGRVGPGNQLANAGCSLTTGCTSPVNPTWVADTLTNMHLFSPRTQIMWEQGVTINKWFRPRWKITIQTEFGKQYGDGQPDTIATYAGPAFGAPGPPHTNAVANGLNLTICNTSIPYYANTNPNAAILAGETPLGSIPYCKAGFTGASYLEYLGQVTYNLTQKTELGAAKWNVTLRAEQFRNPNRYFLQPIAAQLTNTYGQFTAEHYWGLQGAIAGAFNFVNVGLNYNPATHFRFRPEIRYDWQSGNFHYNGYGQMNPNGVTSSSQVTFAMDSLFYF